MGHNQYGKPKMFNMLDISCNDPFNETSPIIPSHTTMSPKDLLDKSIEVGNKSCEHNSYHHPNETSLSSKPKWIDFLLLMTEMMMERSQINPVTTKCLIIEGKG